MKTIPSEFIHLDGNVHGESKPFNVRDIQVIQANQNILYARRIRRPLVTQCFFSDNSAGTMLAASVEPVNASGGSEAFWRNSIRISPNVQEIVVNLMAYKSATGTDEPDVLVYPYLTGPYRRQEIDEDALMTVSDTSVTKYSSTLSVPPDCFGRANGAGVGYLSMFWVCGVDQDDAKVPATISNFGESGNFIWVESTSEPAIGRCAYFSLSTIRPRIVRGSTNQGGGVFRTYMDGPWEAFPVIGTTTIGSKLVPTLNLEAMTVYELELTNFFAARKAS